jgi:hypothetical protein
MPLVDQGICACVPCKKNLHFHQCMLYSVSGKNTVIINDEEINWIVNGVR